MKQDLPFAHFAILILLLLIAVNLLILDIKIFYPQNILLSETKTMPFPAVSNEAQPPVYKIDNSQCPVACLNLIGQATSGSNIGSPDQTAPIVSKQAAVAKEYFIPLGQGETSKNNWDDIIGTETVINPAVYGQIKETYFIASLKNPTKNGQVEVRLYNVTDNNVVYGSHVVMTNLTEQTITSEKFALPNSSKLLRAQLKSTLGYPVTLENARLKILAY